MKWPWISRRIYDEHTQLLINSQGGLIKSNERLHELVERLYDDLNEARQVAVNSLEEGE